MLCPWLKYPITNLGGAVRLENGALMVITTITSA